MKTHISLNVGNIGNSIEFYKAMFGVDPFKVKSDYAKFDILNPPLNLTMNQTKFDRGGAISHLGVQVDSTNEVLEIGKRWSENGLFTFDEIQTDCCYALQDKIWVTDPDGNRWEVFTVLENTEGVKNSNAGCCSPVENAVNITRSKANSCC